MKIDKTGRVEWDDVGFHKASVSFRFLAAEQFMSLAEMPVHRVLVTGETLRNASQQICGMDNCECGGGITPIGEDKKGRYWVMVDPADVSFDDGDGWPEV